MSDRKPSPFPILLNNDVCSLIRRPRMSTRSVSRTRAANAYLVRGKSRTIMIDVGLSSNYPALLECLHHLGCPPEKSTWWCSATSISTTSARPIISTVAPSSPRTGSPPQDHAARRFLDAAQDVHEPDVPINIDIWLEEGNLLDLGNFRLNVMYTPGHTSACISLFDQDQGLLFAADTLMPGGVMGGCSDPAASVTTSSRWNG